MNSITPPSDRREVSVNLDLDELPASAASGRPPTAATIRPAAELARARLHMQTAVDATVDREKSRNPELYKKLRVQMQMSIKPRATPGSTQRIQAIVERILTVSGASETQTAIRAYVQARFPGQPIVKDWTKPLHRWELEHVKTRILGSGQPFNTIRVSSGMSLRDLHRSARTALEKQQTGVISFSPAVQVSDDSVVINGVSFKLSKNKTGGHTYKQLRVSMSQLEQALQSKR